MTSTSRGRAAWSVGALGVFAIGSHVAAGCTSFTAEDAPSSSSTSTSTSSASSSGSSGNNSTSSSSTSSGSSGLEEDASISPDATIPAAPPCEEIGAKPILVGEGMIPTTTNSAIARAIDAYGFEARSSGTARCINLLILVGGNTELQLGVYDESGNNPNQLLARASVPAPIKQGWVRATLDKPISITASQRYFLALHPRTDEVQVKVSTTCGSLNRQRTKYNVNDGLPQSFGTYDPNDYCNAPFNLTP